MSEMNRSVAVRWFEEVWNQRRVESIAQLMALDAVGHMEGQTVVGPAGFQAVHAAMLSALPDMRVTVEDAIVQDNNVVVRWFVRGTHTGDGLGIPPTGLAVAVRGMTWMRVENGRMVEGWDAWNQGAFIQSLQAARRLPAGDGTASRAVFVLVIWPLWCRL